MNYLEIFQSLGFPVAICCVLFSIMIYFFKRFLVVFQDMMAANEKKEADNRKYLQDNNQELCKIIALNTQALNRFSYLMGVLSKELKKQSKGGE